MRGRFGPNLAPPIGCDGSAFLSRHPMRIGIRTSMAKRMTGLRTVAARRASDSIHHGNRRGSNTFMRVAHASVKHALAFLLIPLSGWQPAMQVLSASGNGFGVEWAGLLGRSEYAPSRLWLGRATLPRVARAAMHARARTPVLRRAGPSGRTTAVAARRGGLYARPRRASPRRRAPFRGLPAPAIDERPSGPNGNAPCASGDALRRFPPAAVDERPFGPDGRGNWRGGRGRDRIQSCMAAAGDDAAPWPGRSPGMR